MDSSAGRVWAPRWRLCGCFPCNFAALRDAILGKPEVCAPRAQTMCSCTELEAVRQDIHIVNFEGCIDGVCSRSPGLLAFLCSPSSTPPRSTTSACLCGFLPLSCTRVAAPLSTQVAVAFNIGGAVPSLGLRNQALSGQRLERSPVLLGSKRAAPLALRAAVDAVPETKKEQKQGRGVLKARPIGVGHAAPTISIPNKDMENIVETTDEWIQTRTGIGNKQSARGHTHTHIDTCVCMCGWMDGCTQVHACMHACMHA